MVEGDDRARRLSRRRHGRRAGRTSPAHPAECRRLRVRGVVKVVDLRVHATGVPRDRVVDHEDGVLDGRIARAHQRARPHRDREPALHARAHDRRVRREMEAAPGCVESREPACGCERAGVAAALEIDAPQVADDVQDIGAVDVTVAIEVEQSRSGRDARKPATARSSSVAACRPQPPAGRRVDRKQCVAAAACRSRRRIETPVVAAGEQHDPVVRVLARVRDVEARDDRLRKAQRRRVAEVPRTREAADRAAGPRRARSSARRRGRGQRAATSALRPRARCVRRRPGRAGAGRARRRCRGCAPSSARCARVHGMRAAAPSASRPRVRRRCRHRRHAAARPASRRTRCEGRLPDSRRWRRHAIPGRRARRTSRNVFEPIRRIGEPVARGYPCIRLRASANRQAARSAARQQVRIGRIAPQALRSGTRQAIRIDGGLPSRSTTSGGSNGPAGAWSAYFRAFPSHRSLGRGADSPKMTPGAPVREVERHQGGGGQLRGSRRPPRRAGERARPG